MVHCVYYVDIDPQDNPDPPEDAPDNPPADPVVPTTTPGPSVSFFPCKDKKVG